MFGILNLYKPAGWTSRDVVNRVQKVVRPAKAGHAGTLDPLATGVLVVCVGPATKLISYVQQQEKEYDATFLLGRTSPSDDVETEVSELENAPKPTQQEINAKLPEFLGTIQQRPPSYSALKVEGQRAYKLARGGADVELPPRPVEIHQLKIERYDYPELRLMMRCGSGTYVRSVGRDLAESLGTGAVMKSLQRTAIGKFTLSDALDVEMINADKIADHLINPLAAVSQLPRLVLSKSQQKEIQHGRLISTHELNIAPAPDEVYAAVDSTERLLALMKLKRPGMLCPTYNFSQPS